MQVEQSSQSDRDDSGTRQEARGAEPPPDQNETTTQNVTVIIAYGQPGTGGIDAGGNFARAAATMQKELEEDGYTVINVGEIGSTYGFQGVLDTAAKHNAESIYLFTHGATTALDIGDGPRSDRKDVTMNNVKRFSNSSRKLVNMVIYGCEVGASDNGIGQALANQLRIMVQGSTTGMSFSALPNRLTNGPGKKHPNTGPTYMVPEGNGKWRSFFPQ